MIRVPRADRATGATAIEGRTSIRFLSMNVHSRNRSTEAILELIAATDADIVVMVESSWYLMKALSDSETITHRYPYRFGLESRNYGQIVVLSRFPGSDRPNEDALQDLANHWGFRSGFLDINGTMLRFAAVHAPSPRTKTTWGYGLSTFDRLATHFERVGSAVDKSGIPSVLIGDLNCTPTNTRSKHVNKTLGLRRAKPLGVWDGTYPSNLPWYARSSIDGAFVSEQVQVEHWKTVPIPGSDHRGIVVQISVPSTNGSSDTGND
ncbi:MAG: endonuclease/exonuclease/phosphatase family protein, partial [Phycisphaerales bacterium JB050]